MIFGARFFIISMAGTTIFVFLLVFNLMTPLCGNLGGYLGSIQESHGLASGR
jgi:hypothetical protein